MEETRHTRMEMRWRCNTQSGPLPTESAVSPKSPKVLNGGNASHTNGDVVALQNPERALSHRNGTVS